MDEGELLVLCARLMRERSPKGAAVDEGELAAMLRTFRTDPGTPLSLDLDAFVRVYGDVVSTLPLNT